MLRKSLVLLLPAAVMVAAAWMTLQGFRAPGAVAEEIHNDARYELQNAEWTRYSDDGQVDLRAHAERIDYYDDRSMRLTAVALDRLGGENGRWQLQAAEGQVPAGETRIRLQPEVLINGTLASGAPAQMQTRNVWVDWTRKTIVSSEAVTMSSPGRELRAIGLEADWAGEHLQFKKQVEVRYAPPG
jgi:LPS export ABC transporter protein LptC